MYDTSITTKVLKKSLRISIIDHSLKILIGLNMLLIGMIIIKNQATQIQSNWPIMIWTASVIFITALMFIQAFKDIFLKKPMIIQAIVKDIIYHRKRWGNSSETIQKISFEILGGVIIDKKQQPINPQKLKLNTTYVLVESLKENEKDEFVVSSNGLAFAKLKDIDKSNKELGIHMGWDTNLIATILLVSLFGILLINLFG